MPKRAGTEHTTQALSPAERRLAQILASDTDVAMWVAGWKAGYCGVDPDGPEPKPGSPERKKLADSAGRARKRPHVQAEIQRLRNAAASDVVKAAKNGDPEAAAIVAARERTLDAAVAEQDAVTLGAGLLDLKLRAAQADMGDFADWGSDWATVKAKDELTPEQRQLIRKIQFHPTCGKCGAEHASPGVTLELEPRATFAAQATKQLGLDAPKKLEVAGKDGGPIQVGVEFGLSKETIQVVRFAIIGRPVEAASA